MDRTLTFLFGALGAALVSVGLTFSRAVDAPASFRFANGTEPKTLDPALMTGQPEGRIAEAIFEGLTRHDAATLRPAPGVAESWDIEDDGKRYVFHLRANARWSDGHPVTAQDFVWSFRRLLDPALAAEYAYIVFPIRLAEAMNTYDGHAATLEGQVATAVAAFAAAHPAGADAASFQRLLGERHATDALRHVTDAVVAPLLARNEGTLTPAELARVRDGLVATAARLRAEAAHARAHLGVDQGVFAPDPRTVVIELRAPTPYFLDVTSFHTTLPVPSFVAGLPGREKDWFLPEHLVTNGPYRLTRWLVNDHIRLERSETYWGRDEVKLERIDALSLESATTALNLYLTGELDWLPSQYPLDLTAELRKRADFYANPGMVVYFYRFNTTAPPFQDVRVREALNLAVDRNLIVERVLGLGQLPATTFVPPDLAGYEPPDSAIRLDVPRARALLAEAGYPDGRGFPEIGILYNTSEAHKLLAEVIADQLHRNLGITVNAYNQEWQSFLDTVRSGKYTMARAAWVGDYADPNTFLDMWLTAGGNNQTGFSSAAYDRLVAASGDVSRFAAAPEPLLAVLKRPARIADALAAARAETDARARVERLGRVRMELFREAEAILVQDEFPILPLYFYVVSGLVSPRVRGFHTRLELGGGKTAANVQDLHPLRDLSLASAGGSP